MPIRLAAIVNGDITAMLFASQATNLGPTNVNSSSNIANNGSNLFVYPAFSSGPLDLSSQTVVQVSAETVVYDTSQDGRYVVFTTNAPFVVSNQEVDQNSDQDVFVYDRVSGTIALVSHAFGTPLTAADSGSPDTVNGTQPFGSPVVISQDGNWIAFVSDATNLLTNNSAQFLPSQVNNVYLFDNEAGPSFGAITLVSHLPGNQLESDFESSFDPAISADGRYIAFASFSGNLVSGDSSPIGGFANIFLYDQDNPNDIQLVSERRRDAGHRKRLFDCPFHQ